MAIDPQLRDELTQILLDMPPMPVELVLATGEVFSSEALDLARVYDNATNGQRSALTEIANSFKSSFKEEN